MGYNKYFNLKPLNPKHMTNHRIALCGPSGSGKTTLARKISEEYKIPYTENSAGLLLPDEDQKYLVDNFGWTKSGHADVIKLSHQNPQFGWEFQSRLLIARSKFIQSTPSFVIDRSPIDNLAYFLLQNAQYNDTQVTKYFIESAQLASNRLTHLIFIPTMLTGEIENNGSRVANYYYQQMVTAVFVHVIENYFSHVPKVELITSSFSVRWEMTKNFLRP